MNLNKYLMKQFEVLNGIRAFGAKRESDFDLERKEFEREQELADLTKEMAERNLDNSEQ